MKSRTKQFLSVFGFAAVLLLPAAAQAKVFICVDSRTGEQTFTDSACPDSGSGELVKVEPANFNARGPTHDNRGTWSSDRTQGTPSTAVKSSHQRRISAAHASGYLPKQR